MKVIFGVDPGLSGAVVSYATATGVCKLSVMPTMPALRGHNKRELNARELVTWFDTQLTDLGITDPSTDSICVMEDVHAMPKQGITSAFTFGENVGALKAVVRVKNIPLVMVTPQAWKKVVLGGTAKDKSAAIAYVHSRFPGITLRATLRCTTDHDGLCSSLS